MTKDKHSCARYGISSCDPCMEWRISLWRAINNYAKACGGDPAQGVSSADRMQAVVEVEDVIKGAALADQIRS